VTTLSIPPWDPIAEWTPHVVWVTDAKGSTEYFNRRGHDLVGLTFVRSLFVPRTVVQSCRSASSASPTLSAPRAR
jgi:PAS domain-containing protein